MKSTARFKKFAWIIAGSIVGAVALTSSSIILVLLISGTCVALPFFGSVIETWTKQWTLEGIYSVFIIAGCVGLVFGAFLGKRHLQTIQKWFSSALILGIPMIFCLWLFYGCASHVAIPREIKLTDCTNNTVLVQLTVPKGRNYRLVLTAPSGSTNIVSGRVIISSGATAITNFSIGSNTGEQQCDFFHAESRYNVEIKFDQTPSSTSIWLRWLQAYKDRSK